MTRGCHRTLVHVTFTECSCPAHWTLTSELSVGCFGYAAAAVTTLVRRARIKSVFTVASGVRRCAHAAVAVDEVDARAAVQARVTGAVVDVCLAVHTSKSKYTITLVSIEPVVASSSVLTRVRTAFVNITFTALTSVSR